METASLAALKTGDQGAWEAFFAEFDPLIRSVTTWSKWRFAPHEQEELVQDIRSQLTRSIGTYRGEARLDYFIKRVCVHRCVDAIRRKVREGALFTSLTVTDDEGVARERDITAGAEFDPVEALVRFERTTTLLALVDSLDETCRIAVRHFYLDQLTYKEIAGKLNIAINTVGSRLSKCLEKLRTLARNHRVGREYLEKPGDKSEGPAS